MAGGENDRDTRMSAKESRVHGLPTTGISPPRRRWCQFSLRTLFLVITVIAGFLSWQAYRAEQEATAVAKLEQLQSKIVFETRKPQWLWNSCGERMGRTVVSVDIPVAEVAAAIPLLKTLPNLRKVDVVFWPWQTTQFKQDDIDAALRRAMPDVKSSASFVMCGYVTTTEPIHVPDGGNVLLGGIRKLAKRRIEVPEEEEDLGIADEEPWKTADGK
jgi:hypothetical protein